MNFIRISETLCICLQNTFELFLGEESSFWKENAFFRIKVKCSEFRVFSIILLPILVCKNAHLNRSVAIELRKGEGEKKNKTHSTKTPEFLTTDTP